jgi:hypothetical protein
MTERRKPGAVRDAIIDIFSREKRELSIDELRAGVQTLLGGEIAASSVRSYLNLNTPGLFIRTGRGKYRLVRR